MIRIPDACPPSQSSWPYQRPVYSGAILALRQGPGDLCGAARASRPRRSDPDAAGSTAGLPGREQPAATAILHGLPHHEPRKPLALHLLPNLPQ